MVRFASVEEYVAAQPEAVRPLLEEVRRRARRAVPGSTERISYDIPTVVLDGRPVVHFGAWAKHLGVYPRPEPGADPELDRDLEPYVAGKGTLKFPLSEPIPYDVVERLARTLGKRH